jgi:hypothetical protein
MASSTSSRRVMVVGSLDWRDTPATTRALTKVMAVYRGPYTLLLAEHPRVSGAARQANAIASKSGWVVEVHEPVPSCVAGCPPNHAERRGFCPTASQRLREELLATKPDVLVVLARSGSRYKATRLGQFAARHLGIAVWEFEGN